MGAGRVCGGSEGRREGRGRRADGGKGKRERGKKATRVRTLDEIWPSERRVVKPSVARAVVTHLGVASRERSSQSWVGWIDFVQGDRTEGKARRKGDGCWIVRQTGQASATTLGWACSSPSGGRCNHPAESGRRQKSSHTVPSVPSRTLEELAEPAWRCMTRWSKQNRHRHP